MVIMIDSLKKVTYPKYFMTVSDKYFLNSNFRDFSVFLINVFLTNQ